MRTSLVNALTDGDDPEPVYTPEEAVNLELIRTLRAAPLHERRLFLQPDAVVHRNGMYSLGVMSGTGMSGYQPDSILDRVDVIQDIIAKGDRVWAVWSLTGTHTGTLYGFSATGRPIDITEMAIWRIKDGLVAEHWYFADDLTLLRQLGVVPDFHNYSELTRGQWRTAEAR